MGKGDKRQGSKRRAREPNGRLSRKKSDVETRKREAKRAAFEDGPMQTVLRARRRHKRKINDDYIEDDKKPVTKQQMKNMKLLDRGSFLGRLHAEGEITDRELSAGQDYCQRYITYASLNGLPRPTAKGSNIGVSGGGSRPDRLEAAIRSKAAHMDDMAILRGCSAGVIWAMKRGCITDDEAPVSLVREGLRALVDSGR